MIVLLFCFKLSCFIDTLTCKHVYSVKLVKSWIAFYLSNKIQLFETRT